MMDFLSDVFEFDVDSTNDSVNKSPLFFKLIESTDLATQEHTLNSNIVFSFKVNSEQELREIMSKYNFFLYRKSNTTDKSEKLDLIQSENQKTLIISDIDQRLWRFEYDFRADI